MVKNVNTLLKRPYKVKIGNLTMPIAHQKVSKKRPVAPKWIIYAFLTTTRSRPPRFAW